MARLRSCVQNIDGGVCCLLCLIAVGVSLCTVVSFAACQPVQVWDRVSVGAELLITTCLGLGAGSRCLLQMLRTCQAVAGTVLTGCCPHVPLAIVPLCPPSTASPGEGDPGKQSAPLPCFDRNQVKCEHLSVPIDLFPFPPPSF